MNPATGIFLNRLVFDRQMDAFLLRPDDRYNYISYVKIDDNWWEFDSLSAGPRRKSHRGAGYQQGYELDNVTILNIAPADPSLNEVGRLLREEGAPLRISNGARSEVIVNDAKNDRLWARSIETYIAHHPERAPEARAALRRGAERRPANEAVRAAARRGAQPDQAPDAPAQQADAQRSSAAPRPLPLHANSLGGPAIGWHCLPSPPHVAEADRASRSALSANEPIGPSDEGSNALLFAPDGRALYLELLEGAQSAQQAVNMGLGWRALAVESWFELAEQLRRQDEADGRCWQEDYAVPLRGSFSANLVQAFLDLISVGESVRWLNGLTDDERAHP